MSNIYIGYHFNIEPKELGSEILIAELKSIRKFYRNRNGISSIRAKDLWMRQS
jgi:ribosomal protein L11 methyltransferase